MKLILQLLYTKASKSIGTLGNSTGSLTGGFSNSLISSKIIKLFKQIV